jgi:hypothetical protein
MSSTDPVSSVSQTSSTPPPASTSSTSSSGVVLPPEGNGYTDYCFPAGINSDPSDDYGISDDPAVAEEQLLELMEWSKDVGVSTNVALVWVFAMIGLNMRLNEWNSEGLGQDPSVLAIEDSLNLCLTVTGTMTDKDGNPVTLSLSDMVVGTLATMLLYSTYINNGGDLNAANETVQAALTSADAAYKEADAAGKIENPMLTAFDDSINKLLDNYDAWESQFIDSSGGLVNADLGYNGACDWMAGYVGEWCYSSNLDSVEAASRSDWCGRLIGAGLPLVYVLCLILSSIYDEYGIKAGAISYTLDAYTELNTEYSDMQEIVFSGPLDGDQMEQMYNDATDIQQVINDDPRLSSSQPAADACASLLDVQNPYDSEGNAYPADENPNPTVGDLCAEGDYDGAADAWNAAFYGADPTNSTQVTAQSTRVQQLNNALSTGSNSLTSYAATLASQEQMYEQMANQAAQTEQTVVDQTGSMMDQILSNMVVA